MTADMIFLRRKFSGEKETRVDFYIFFFIFLKRNLGEI